MLALAAVSSVSSRSSLVWMYLNGARRLNKSRYIQVKSAGKCMQIIPQCEWDTDRQRSHVKLKALGSGGGVIFIANLLYLMNLEARWQPGSGFQVSGLRVGSGTCVPDRIRVRCGSSRGEHPGSPRCGAPLGPSLCLGSHTRTHTQTPDRSRSGSRWAQKHILWPHIAHGYMCESRARRETTLSSLCVEGCNVERRFFLSVWCRFSQ